MAYRTLGEIFSSSFEKYKRYFSPIVLTGLILYLVPIVLASIIQSSLGISARANTLYGPKVSLDPASIAIYIVVQVIVGLLGLLFSVSIIRLLSDKPKAENAAVGTIIRNGLPYLRPAFAASLLVGLAIMAIYLPLLLLSALLGPVGIVVMLLGLILIIALVFYWIFVIYAVVADRVPVTKSMSYSMRLVKGSWWRIFGYVLLIALILGAMGFVLLMVFGIFAIFLGTLGVILMALAGGAVGLFVSPYVSIFFYELYQALKAEKGITSTGASKDPSQNTMPN